MGDTVYGMNVSFIDHLDVAFSAGAALLLLFLIGAFCACRKGMCLKWILGKRFMHMHQPPATPTSHGDQHANHRLGLGIRHSTVQIGKISI